MTEIVFTLLVASLSVSGTPKLEMMPQTSKETCMKAAEMNPAAVCLPLAAHQ